MGNTNDTKPLYPNPSSYHNDSRACAKPRKQQQQLQQPIYPDPSPYTAYYDPYKSNNRSNISADPSYHLVHNLGSFDLPGDFRILGHYAGKPLFQLRKKWEENHVKIGADVDLLRGHVRSLVKVGPPKNYFGVDGYPIPELMYASIQILGNTKSQIRLHIGWNFTHQAPHLRIKVKALDRLRPRLGNGTEDYYIQSDAIPLSGPNAASPSSTISAGVDYSWRIPLSPTSVLKFDTGVDLPPTGYLIGPKKAPMRWVVSRVRVKQYITNNPWNAFQDFSRGIYNLLTTGGQLPQHHNQQQHQQHTIEKNYQNQALEEQNLL